ETRLYGGESLCTTDTGAPDGCFVSPRLWGTYLHGILDNPGVVEEILKACGNRARLTEFNYSSFKEEQYDKLAAHVRANVNMDYVYSVLQADKL
ncbi:MAG: cobyric acid synthase, partial [Prolixibacteraceae bacterium]